MWFSRGCGGWVAVLFGAIVLTGCSFLPIEQLGGRQYAEGEVYAQDLRTVFESARTALNAMGYEVQSGSPADGKLEMAARVLPGGSAEPVRQRSVVLTFEDAPESGTTLRVTFSETLEESGISGERSVTTRVLRGGAIYDAFWARLDHLLPPDATAPVGPIPATPPTP